VKLAPIVLFVYNRPWHTQRTVEALVNNKYANESELFVYSDGAKNENQIENVSSVRNYIKTIQGFNNVTIIESPVNKGLAQSIIYGVTEIISKYGTAIVLEDDLDLSPFFLEFLNTGLNKYENDENVMQISGHMFNVKFRKNVPESFFLSQTTTLGWGTWKRAWKHLDINFKNATIFENNNRLKQEFNLNGNYPFFEMIERHKKREISSWGIIWYLTVFSQKGLVLHPKNTLVVHFGWEEATHASNKTKIYCDNYATKPIKYYPTDLKILDEIKNHYYSKFKVKHSLIQKALHFIKTRVKNIST
jgi:hypothetical protein